MLSIYCISVTTHFVCNYFVVDCCIIFLVVAILCWLHCPHVGGPGALHLPTIFAVLRTSLGLPLSSTLPHRFSSLPHQDGVSYVCEGAVPLSLSRLPPRSLNGCCYLFYIGFSRTSMFAWLHATIYYAWLVRFLYSHLSYVYFLVPWFAVQK